jgi:phage gp36-like protein
MQDYMEPADGRIDSMLGRVMTVPVSPTPAILRDCNKAFTLWMFYSDRFAAAKDEAPPGIKDRYDACMEFFSEVMSGNAVLVTDSAVLITPTTLDSTTKDFKPIFDLRDFGDMRADPDFVEQDDDEDE